MTLRDNGLTDQEQKFCDLYIINMNATESAWLTYSCKNRSIAAQIGHEIINKPVIREYIAKQFRDRAMQVDEVLQRLAFIARGSMESFIRLEGNKMVIDLNKAQESGSLGLIKRIVKSPKAGVQIELYSALEALDKISHNLGMSLDRFEVSGPYGGPIEFAGLGMNDEQLANRIAGLLEAARNRKQGSATTDNATEDKPTE